MTHGKGALLTHVWVDFRAALNGRTPLPVVGFGVVETKKPTIGERRAELKAMA